MSKLARHLRETGDHARLSFHPGCAVCRRERLAGELPDRAVVPAGLKAGIAAAALIGASPQPAQAGAVKLAQAPAIEPRDTPRPPSRTRPQLSEEEQAPPAKSAPPRATPPPKAPSPRSAPRLEALREIESRRKDVPRRPARARGTQRGAKAREEQKPRSQEPSRAAPERAEAPSNARSRDTEQPRTRPRIADPYSRSAPLFLPAHKAAKEKPSKARAADPALERIELSGRKRAVVVSERRLTERLGRAPSEPEIAREAGLPRQEVTSLRGQVKRELREAGENGKGRSDRSAAHMYTVRRGDSLWAIAREELGEKATDAEVMEMVEALWRRNHRVIGTGDPDLIYPGQRIEVRA